MAAANLDDPSSFEESGYRQLFELGRGGMARVFLAERSSSGVRKVVVIKVLKPEFRADEETRAAFQREAELSAQLNHPNVVQVLEVVEGTAPGIVMEYLDGVSLGTVLKHAQHALPLPLHIHVLSQVLAGLHHFHELRNLDGEPLNPVHRDVSPQNIMVLHDGAVKLLDFGIAKVTLPFSEVTRVGVFKGKIHYMPPEQLLGGQNVDRRTDVFSVGVMLWEAVARRRIWQDVPEIEVLRALSAGEVPRLTEHVAEVPDSFRHIVDRATAVDPSDRFATAQEMQSAIDQALREQGWFVQPRELAEFMAEHFGASRRARELKLKTALRAPFANSEVRSTEGERTPQSYQPTMHTLSEAPSRRGRVWLLGAAALVGLAVVAVALARKVLPPREAAPRSVILEIEARPVGARIALNGKMLGVNRFVGTQPVSSEKTLLEVSAPGYVTERKELVLRSNTTVEMVLEPIPAHSGGDRTGDHRAEVPKPVPSRSPEQATSPEAARGRELPRRRARAVSRVESRDCDPPYTFSADGVKTYKVECF